MKSLVFAVAAAVLLSGALPPRAPGAHAEGQGKAAPVTPSAQELDRLLAPIALYPDTLLGQMLLSATNMGKVGALSEWLNGRSGVAGTELQDAARGAGFDENFVALTVFPDVVHWMAGQAEAMSRVGSAFTADPSQVFASIQRLRTKAKSAGKLKTTPQQEVEVKTASNGQEVIVIEPTNPQVVYVPQYDPNLVYTSSSTVVVQTESSSSDAVAAGLIGFTAGIAMGAAFDNDYYYGPYGWGGGFYMYDDAWDDWYDNREDMREDWYDNREDLAETRSDARQNTQEQRTERQENRVENRPETTQAQRDQRRTEAQSKAQTRSSGSSEQSRGFSRDGTATQSRSGSGGDAFSGYSSGKSTRAASQRGQGSRSSSRGSGGRRR